MLHDPEHWHDAVYFLRNPTALKCDHWNIYNLNSDRKSSIWHHLSSFVSLKAFFFTTQKVLETPEGPDILSVTRASIQTK